MEASGVRSWIAPDDILPGADWPEAITTALESCRGLAVLLSPSAIQSRQVAREVALAIERNKPIVPIRLANVVPTGSLRYLLQLVQWIDAYPVSERTMAAASASTLAALESPVDEPLSLEPPDVSSELSSLVGRDSEIDEVETLLRSRPLVVLTGPGGVGKTRVARAVAQRARHNFPDGVVFVSLEAATHPNQVLSGVAAAAGLEIGADPRGDLRRSLRGRRLLLILDNVEQIPSVSEPIGGLLEDAPTSAVLVTSRLPTRVRGERLVRLMPLPIGGLHDGAVRLFYERAGELGAELDPAFADQVAALCRRLDGLPLGVEIAAAQTRVLSLDVIAEQLDSHADLHAMADVPERQVSLSRTVEWSYSLLDADTQRLLGSLAAFSGSFDLTAIRAVADGGDGANAMPTLDAFTRLFDHSLVMGAPDAGPNRFRILETVREFSLARSPDRNDVEARHFAFFEELVGSGASHLVQADRAEWLARLTRDEANIVAALHRAENLRVLDRAVRMASQFRRYWSAKGRLPDARKELERLLRRPDALTDAVRAEALNALGAVRVQLSDLDGARIALTEALALRRGLGDLAGVAVTLCNLAAAHRYPGGAARMKELLAESIELSKQVNDEWGAVASMANLAIAFSDDGEHEEAASQYERAAHEFNRLGDVASVAMATLGQGSVRLRQGRLDQARPHVEQALETYVALDDPEGVASAGLVLGQLQAWEGHPEEAVKTLTRALAGSAAAGDDYGVAEGLERLADAAWRMDEVGTAGVLLGRARAIRQANDWPVEEVDRVWLEPLHDRLVSTLGSAQVDQLLRAGDESQNEDRTNWDADPLEIARKIARRG